MSRLRFVFISTMHGYPWGGSAELWSQAARRLRAAGHDVAAMKEDVPLDPAGAFCTPLRLLAGVGGEMASTPARP